ncbi:hypothetical protein IX317_000352 [Fusobacterium sp. DD29]|uniref:hypothetical protein n=1 Tax=unclassified Fusobacterium TaxID=2648384 RepID=UPI001B8C20E3|nr:MULTISPECIES: hypothetical protein [unclassified Fusobacterium]MBR8748693.1 hypothetical protein [Fusobacterium sp. DD29]MBR8760955.1 hypothetical protein [Fusobacterium sp. DD25]MBR8766972.1 hypothetical protein [Fusobacterium sp. DD43]MBR8770973.1 hypothetical protein [Fusobacterium sp. DD40]MBR8775248.1 hypothetical protein [Fusobacterium sp. DD17]
MINRMNMFTYGEVGERLGGIRESEIYQQSAQIIEDLVINEMGNLKIAKQFKSTPFNYDFKEIIDTKYAFYICVMADNKVCTFKKNNGQIGSLISENSSTVSNIKVIKMVDDKLFVIGDTTKVYEFNKDNGQVGVSNFLDLIKLPMKNKEVLKIDVYRTYQVQNEMRVSLLGSYENPRFDTTSGTIKIDGTNTTLTRIYPEYKASVTNENIEGLSNGLTFGVMRNFYKTDNNKKFYIGNTEITFTGEKNDSKYGGKYFTGISGKGNGVLKYGELIKINEGLTTVGLYQDRLIIIHNGTFYFSKKSDYFDFTNDIKTDSAFYFKPTPIDNIFPEIYDMYIGDKIYIPNSRGVYVISTNNILSNNSYGVFIASELPANINAKYTYKNNCVLLNNTFYYLTENNELRSIEQIPTSVGIENYTSGIVEKYEIVNKFDSIYKFKYNNKYYLMARRDTQKDKIYMYEQLDYKLFRRFSLKLSNGESVLAKKKEYNHLVIIGDNIITDNAILKESTINGNGRLRINPPFMKSEKGGSYSNDYSSRVVRVFIKVLNQDKEAIKGIKINNTLITKNAIEDDLFSVFKIETSFPVLNGFDIGIISNENDKIFEILGIDLKIEVVSD